MRVHIRYFDKNGKIQPLIIEGSFRIIEIIIDDTVVLDE